MPDRLPGADWNALKKENVGALPGVDWSTVGDNAPTSTPEHTAAGQLDVHPGQFQMFMTPNEITRKYQVLDGDRQEAYDPRAGELTARSHRTDAGTNTALNTGRREQHARWHGGASQIEEYTHIRSDSYAPETDEQVLSRKLEESQMEPWEYREVHGGEASEGPGWNTLAQRSSAPSGMKNPGKTGMGTGTREERSEEANYYVEAKQQEHYEAEAYGPSLYDKIHSQGVQSPVHLAYEQFGSQGKLEILGGHHRLAAQQDIDPDQPIPVSHHATFHAARKSGSYD
jgi:hypothetical protein